MSLALKKFKIRHPRTSFAICASLLCSMAWAGVCSPSGVYIRSPGNELKVEAVDESVNPASANFELMTLGRMVFGAPTVGRSEGKILLAYDHCIGVYTEPGTC